MTSCSPVAHDAVRLGFMPPDRTLDAADVAAFVAWIDAGAPE